MDRGLELGGADVGSVGSFLIECVKNGLVLQQKGRNDRIWELCILMLVDESDLQSIR